jgi:hypothetical protein
MIEEEIPKDVSLLRCTVKKSQQVFAKIVLLVSYVIVALALLGCGYLLFTGVLIPIISLVVAAILSIPWYYYVAGIAILAIPVYSFLWCIARELTDEDWDSGEAKALVVALIIAALAASIVAGFNIIIMSSLSPFYWLLSSPMIVALVVLSTDSKWMQFPGACLHYWRRMRK